MHTLDISLFYTIYGLAGRAPWSDWLIIFVGQYLLYPLLLLVGVFAYQEWRRSRYERVRGYIIALLTAVIARFGVAEFIRLFYHHQRPFITLNIPHLLTDYAYSFPSGHTIFIFALGAGVYRLNKKLAWCIYVAGLSIGLARVAGGVHYPSDILGGMVLGITTGYIVVHAWKALSRKIAIPSI